jgi:hypothetical protein
MWTLARGLLVVALAALVGGVSAAREREIIRGPAYDEIGHALIFAVGNIRKGRSGLVRVSLDDFSSTALPTPCGHNPFRKIVFLDQGRLMAAWGEPASKPANMKPGNGLLPERERFWQPYDVVLFRQGDWSVVQRLDIDKPFVSSEPIAGRMESIDDISAPDRGRMLLLSVYRPARTAAPRALYGLSIDDWRISLLWPTKPDFNYRSDDSFMDLSAPQWIEDGHWAVRGRPKDENKSWNVPWERRNHSNRWLINPADQSVRLHPLNDTLRMGFTVQQVDGDLYMNVITRNAGGIATYGLKKVTPEPAQLLGSLGDEVAWMYVFSGRGKRQVVTYSRHGRLALRGLPDLHEEGPIDTSRLAALATPWECPRAWNP